MGGGFILNKFPRENIREGKNCTKQMEIYRLYDIVNNKHVFNGVL